MSLAASTRPSPVGVTVVTSLAFLPLPSLLFSTSSGGVPVPCNTNCTMEGVTTTATTSAAATKYAIARLKSVTLFKLNR